MRRNRQLRRATRNLAPLALVLVGAAFAPAAAEQAFDALLVKPPMSLTDTCRNGAVALRAERWTRGRAGEGGGAFAGVGEIMRDVAPPALRQLEAKGCAPRYLHGFLACTEPDGPPSPHIVPRGVKAGNADEMAAIMRSCLKTLAETGISPLQ